MKKLLNLFILLIVLSHSNNTNGQFNQINTTELSIKKLGHNYYWAGIPTEEFDAWAAESVTGNQRQANWCWAACSQMVLNYHGLYIQQEQIVKRIYGKLVDLPANEYQIRAALSGWAPNVQGGISRIYCKSGVFINDIPKYLSKKWPLIVGLKNPYGGIGHAYVLTEIYYKTDKFNNTKPVKVVLRDPMPNIDGRVVLKWQHFYNRVVKAFRVWVSR